MFSIVSRLPPTTLNPWVVEKLYLNTYLPHGSLPFQHNTCLENMSCFSRKLFCKSPSAYVTRPLDCKNFTKNSQLEGR